MLIFFYIIFYFYFEENKKFNFKHMWIVFFFKKNAGLIFYKKN